MTRRSFHPALTAAVLLSAALAAHAVAAPEGAPRSVVLALDDSGSMRLNDPRRLLALAVEGVVNGLDDRDAVGLVVFDERARVLRPLRRLDEPGVRDEMVSAIRGLEYDGRRTNLADAVERGLYALEHDGDAGDQRALVLVTDGILDTGDPAKDASKTRWLRDDLVPACRAAGVRVFGVAFTEEADYELLQTLAHGTGGRYYRALGEADVARIFEDLEEGLREAAREERAVEPEDSPRNAPMPVPLAGERAPAYVKVLLAVAMGLGALAFLLGLSRLRGERRRAPDAVPLRSAVLHDLSTGAEIPVVRRVTRIGRQALNDLVIDSPTISAQHAILEERDGVYHVADLRSTNGTYVNDVPVTRECILRPGDIIRFDRFKFAFEGVVQDDVTQSAELDPDRTFVTAPGRDP